jgi:hypothetical protein
MARSKEFQEPVEEEKEQAPAEVGTVKSMASSDIVLLVYTKKSADVIQGGGIPAVLKLAYKNDPFELKPGEGIKLPREGAKYIMDLKEKWDKTSITMNVVFEVQELTSKK